MSRHPLAAWLILGPTGLTAFSAACAVNSAVAAPTGRLAPQHRHANPIVRLAASDLRRFDSALTSLCQRAHVAIVCEGQPLRSELTEAEVAGIAERVDLSGLPLEEAVAQVAAAFDYVPVRASAAVFVLTKRYSDPDDLPDVTFEEGVRSLDSVLRATRSFSPPASTADAVREILESSSEEERQRLAQGLPVAFLSPLQRRSAWQLACSFKGSFGCLEDIARVAQRLTGCRSRGAYFTRKKYWNLVLPAYVGPFGGPYGLRGAMWSVVLSKWVITESGGGTTFEGPPGVKLVDGDTRIVSQPGQIDPTTPQPRAQIPPPPPSALKCSLGDVAERINRRLPPSANPELPPVKVESFLTAKAVCLAGEQFAPPQALLKAVTDVYGLHIERWAHETRVTLPTPTVLTNGEEVPAEIWRLLPAPFLRAVTGAPAAGAGGRFQPSGTSSDPWRDPSLPAQGRFSSARASGLYVASVRRLREIIEPEIDRRPNHELPVLEAGDEARDLVALSSMATCLFALHSLTRPKLSYITRFDAATLALSPAKGDPNEIDFAIKSVDANGKGSGVSGSVAFPPARR